MVSLFETERNGYMPNRKEIEYTLMLIGKTEAKYEGKRYIRQEITPYGVGQER